MSFDRNLAVIGFIISILSTAFAVWTYVETRQFSQITYSISHEAIFRPSKAVSTSMYLSSNEKHITERVTQTIITIWNGGNVPFKGEDTRSRLTITGDSSVNLLSHKLVLEKVLPGSPGFSISGDDKHIEIDWRVFDPEEAMQIAILSTGNAESLNVSGRFLPGQSVARYPVRSALKSTALFVVYIGGGLLFLIAFGASFRYVDRINASEITRKSISFVLIMLMLFIFVYSSYTILQGTRSYVGDISPIDPDLSYIDINRKIDYRYGPM